MKLTVAALPAALICTVVTAVSAAELPPQNIRQDVGRLILLPGPYLTSPPKAAPAQTGATSLVLPSHAQPASAMTFSRGPLSLGPNPATPPTFAPAGLPLPPADPSALRFDDKLAPTSPALPKSRKAPDPSPDAPR